MVKVRNRVTLSTVADAAGVSIGTVSAVLNNRQVARRIAPATVEVVRLAARKLGYMPDISARRLRVQHDSRRSAVIAFITSYEAPLSVVTPIVLGLRDATQARGKGKEITFTLLVEMFSVGRLSEMPGLLSKQMFNAALICNTDEEDDLFLGRTHLPYPVVLLNRVIAGYNCVVEDAAGGARAAEALVRAKSKRLAVIHGSPLTQATKARVDSFMSMASRLLGVPPVEIVAKTLSEDAACSAMRQFLVSRSKIDGLFTVTDSMALGAYNAMKEAGLRIPQDVAVVGVGDYGISPYFDPQLSTVGVRLEEYGRKVSSLVLDTLSTGGGEGPKRVDIPVDFVARGSSSRS